MTSIPPQTRYYIENSINPVEISNTSSLLERHIESRRHLIEDILHVPIDALAGNSLIEFGPNRGENSILFARYGYSIHFVEPNDIALENLSLLYSSLDLDTYITVETGVLKPNTSHKLYTISLAEGFLNTLADVKTAIKDLCSYSDNFVIFSIHDPIGSFFDNLKTYILRYLANVRNLDPIVTAKSLYYEDFAALKTSRIFDSWVNDTLLNPVITPDTLHSLGDILEYCETIGFKYWSSSPPLLYTLYPKWYKESRKDTLSDYIKSRRFILGPECEGLLSQLYDRFLTLSKLLLAHPSKSSLSEIRSILDYMSYAHLGPNDLVEKLISLFISLEESSDSDIIEFYRSSHALRHWGMSANIVVLYKKHTT